MNLKFDDTLFFYNRISKINRYRYFSISLNPSIVSNVLAIFLNAEFIGAIVGNIILALRRLLIFKTFLFFCG